jgi:ferrous iron transport protein A
MKTLAQATLKQRATVTGITESELKPKLLEMGLYIGKEVSVRFKAPFGDPIAVDVDGYVLSMRLDEARLVQIEHLTT